MSAPAGTTEAAAGAPRPGLLTGPYRTPTIGILVVVTLLAFEQMAVGTTMPVAARELGGLSMYAWGFSAVFISGLVGNVLAGGWADARGPALPLLTGLAIFVAGLVVVGTAPAMAWFVAGRAVQGLGSGLASVPLYVIVAAVYPETSRPRVFAAMSAAWVVPSLVGPSVGGFVAQHLGWRWVFLGLVPLVVPAAAMLAPALRGSRTRGALPRGRTLAAVALAVGAALVLWGIDHRSPLGLPGLAGLAYGLRVLLPRGTLRLGRGLPTAIAMRGLLMGAMSGTEAFIPLALITRHGFSPTAAGIVLTAGALGWSGGSWFQGRFTGGSRARFAVRGAALLTTGVAGIAVALYTSGWAAVPAWIVAGLGMGMAFPTLSVTVLALSAPSEQGANSSALQISDTLGSSLGVGVAGALVNAAGLGAGLAWTLAIVIVAAAAAHRVEAPHARLRPSPRP
ncbi:MFS transporter [Actinoallomurus rhizosphaericola]|uniref:MFS transporter n=1 Tax=Actinoallomurus rhizosphaericola TaxID=2952536 RepID=UPI002091ED85|nr:MFS transporter [Actinoallomurus rhizosphaericola]MCO5994925.1 MFS transporter [Actinoallomurus rhizosphaericola]